MSVERLILAAVRRECARQRIWSKPSSQRLTVQAVGGIIHHAEAGLWFFYAHAAMAAALGQLGQHEAAQKAVRALLALRPDFAATVRQEASGTVPRRSSTSSTACARRDWKFRRAD